VKRLSMTLLSIICCFPAVTYIIETTKVKVFACETIESCQEELTAIESQKETLQAEIDANRNNENEAMTQITKYGEQIELITREMALLENSKTNLVDEIEKIERDVEQKIEHFAQRLIIKQQQANDNTILYLLISSTSIATMMNRWNAIDFFNKQDKSLIDELILIQEELILVKADLEAKENELETLRINIEVAKAEKAVVVEQIKAAIFEAENNHESLVTTTESIENQMDIINRPIPAPVSPSPPVPEATTPSEDSNDSQNSNDDNDNNNNNNEIEDNSNDTPQIMPNSGWYLPVGSSGVVTSYYLSDIYYQEFGSWHLGIDVGSSLGRGTPIYAAQDGWVLFADTWCVEGNKTCNGSFGNLTAISHRNVDGSSFVTVYAHLNTINVHEGDYVYGGTQIATMGNTGNSYGAHLHFEMHRGVETFNSSRIHRTNVTVNPLNYLPYKGTWRVAWDA
jgi:Membrane proteins related to metalloendopeptidases